MNNMIGCYNVVEYDQRILLIKEKTKTGFHWALPAGKLEVGETVFECAAREALEESGLQVVPVSLIGIYQTPQLRENNVINFAFHSTIAGEDWQKDLLPEAVFVNFSELDQMIDNLQLRDFIVAKIISDYREGKRFPLEMVTKLSVQ